MSAAPQTFNDFSSIIFIDSMVVLEGKPLASLPWSELDAVGPTLLLAIPQVLKEVDNKKRDGRLGNRAREFNRLISPAAENGVWTKLIEGAPSVYLGTAFMRKIDWADWDDLDQNEPDARVVAQVLSTSDLPPNKSIFLSQDVNPIAMARRHGLTTRRLPDHWLLDPEPSPAEKENIRLKAQLAAYQKNEPELSVDLKFDPEGTWTIYRVKPLSDTEQSELVEKTIRNNPKPTQSHASFSVLSTNGYDASLDGRYQKYIETTVPEFARSRHRYFEIAYGQIIFRVKLINDGIVQAENLKFSLTAVGGTLHDKFNLPWIFGPPTPKPKYYNRFSFHDQFIGQPSFNTDRHEVHFADEPNHSQHIEFRCEDFRQGQKWEFEGIATVDPQSGPPFKIIITATASNLHGTVRAIFDKAFEIKDVALNELVDDETNEWVVDYPLKDRVLHEMGAENWSWFESSNDEDQT